jgi:hypothetical protein
VIYFCLGLLFAMIIGVICLAAELNNRTNEKIYKLSEAMKPKGEPAWVPDPEERKNFGDNLDAALSEDFKALSESVKRCSKCGRALLSDEEPMEVEIELPMELEIAPLPVTICICERCQVAQADDAKDV